MRRRFRRCLQGELTARPDAESRSLVAAGEAPKPSCAGCIRLPQRLERSRGKV